MLKVHLIVHLRISAHTVDLLDVNMMKRYLQFENG